MGTYSASRQGGLQLVAGLTVESFARRSTYIIPTNGKDGPIDYASKKGRHLSAAETLALDAIIVHANLIKLFGAIAAENPEYELGITDHGGCRSRATVNGQDVDLNRAVGGAKGSTHKSGRAGDLWLKHRVTGKYMPAHILAVKGERIMVKLGIRGGVGVYPGYDWYVHFDVRGSWAAWYRTYDGAKCPAQGGRYCAFRKGHEAAGVRIMQDWLIAHGYKECGGPDGVFGDMTEKALKRFQKEHALKVDGIFGKGCNAAMGKILPW